MDKQHRRPARPTHRKSPGLNWRTVRDAVLVAAILVIAASFVLRNGRHVRPPPALTGTPLASSMKPIDGVRCDSQEGAAYHIHAHLQIIGSGKPVTVPESIGIPSDTCFYWLHTHDDSGVIHVEAPKTFRPTLGDFFDIWSQPLSPRRVANVVVTRGRTMRVYVNRKPYTHNLRSITLHDHMNITIEVGPPFQPPSKYDFAAAGL